MILTIFTDGASRGNPGESSYGYTIRNEDGRVVYEEGKYIGIATNNFAEYSAVLAAFDFLNKKFSDRVGLRIKFFMDSMLVAQQLSGRFKVKSPNLKPLIDKIREISIGFGEVSFTHVPREKNKLADALANRALDNR